MYLQRASGSEHAGRDYNDFMRALNLIAHLQELVKSHGDLEVKVEDYDDDGVNYTFKDIYTAQKETRESFYAGDQPNKPFIGLS